MKIILSSSIIEKGLNTYVNVTFQVLFLIYLQNFVKPVYPLQMKEQKYFILRL